MIDTLINSGVALETEADEVMGMKSFNSVNFEEWVSKSILYLENYHKSSAITEKAEEGYRKLNSNTNFQYYQFLLGSLKAVKEFEDIQVDDYDNY
ncbi:hypothetical protein [Peribacillus butanolivorans]|uniref:hypothetical protein n=1 Tax=Peribacillus butanolivorans TaxID=421767 RepID=UPI0036DF5E0F